MRDIKASLVDTIGANKIEKKKLTKIRRRKLCFKFNYHSAYADLSNNFSDLWEINLQEKTRSALHPSWPKYPPLRLYSGDWRFFLLLTVKIAKTYFMYFSTSALIITQKSKVTNKLIKSNVIISFKSQCNRNIFSLCQITTF